MCQHLLTQGGQQEAHTLPASPGAGPDRVVHVVLRVPPTPPEGDQVEPGGMLSGVNPRRRELLSTVAGCCLRGEEESMLLSSMG